MQRREEEWRFRKRQYSGLVQKLETRETEQEQVLVDKGLWEPQLTVERMDETLQEQLNTWDKAIKGRHNFHASFRHLGLPRVNTRNARH